MSQETLVKLSKGHFSLQTAVFLVLACLRKIKEQFGLQKAPVRVLFHQREDLTLSLVETGHVTLFQVPPSFFPRHRIQIDLKDLKIVGLFTEMSGDVIHMIHLTDLLFMEGFFLTHDWLIYFSTTVYNMCVYTYLNACVIYLFN